MYENKEMNKIYENNVEMWAVSRVRRRSVIWLRAREGEREGEGTESIL